MKKEGVKAIIPIESIEAVIHIIRGQKVIIDEDLAALYGVPTKRLNEQVRRNSNRFPEDFAFQLIKEEWDFLKCQFGTSNSSVLRSHFATSSSDWGGRRKLPFVFTEHGVVMAANILKNKRAVSISIEIVHAFIRLRQIVTTHKETAKEVSKLKDFVLKHSNANDREFKRVWNAIDKLSEPIKNKEHPKIGFELG